MKELIGYQIVDENNEPPFGYETHEVFQGDPKVMFEWVLFQNTCSGLQGQDGVFKVIPIFEQDVEEPEFMPTNHFELNFNYND